VTTVEWLALTLLGIGAMVAGWLAGTALQLPLLGGGLAAAGVAAALSGTGGVAWKHVLAAEAEKSGRARWTLGVATALAACIAGGGMLWSGWLAQSSAATNDQGWNDFLNQLLQEPADPTVEASSAAPAASATASAVPTTFPTTSSPASAIASPSVSASVSPARPGAAAGSARPAVAGLTRELNQAMIAAAAQTLHESAATLRGQLNGGSSLREVAATDGVPFTSVQDAVENALKPVLSRAVAAGTLSSSQETALLKAVMSPQFGTRPGLPKA